MANREGMSAGIPGSYSWRAIRAVRQLLELALASIGVGPDAYCTSISLDPLHGGKASRHTRKILLVPKSPNPLSDAAWK